MGKEVSSSPPAVVATMTVSRSTGDGGTDPVGHRGTARSAGHHPAGGAKDLPA
jgi:hypothetical protein